LIPQPVFPNGFFSKLLKETKSSDLSIINEKQIVDSIKSLSERLRYYGIIMQDLFVIHVKRNAV
jgi:hypothetical protein